MNFDLRYPIHTYEMINNFYFLLSLLLISEFLFFLLVLSLLLLKTVIEYEIGYVDDVQWATGPNTKCLMNLYA
jgi:hypothetical protein